MKRVRRIEKLLDGGLLVELSDGTTARYAKASDLPGDLAAALLGRMDAADGGDGDGQPQGDADAARAGYMARLEAANALGRLRHDPGQGLSGQAAYRARLEGAWGAPPPAKGRVGDHKRWQGA